MFARQRGISTVGSVLAVMALSGIFLGSYVYSQGAVSISVQEDRKGGDNIRLWVPGVVVPVAMSLIPDRVFKDIPAEAIPVLRSLEVVADELGNLPDGPLVEVESRDEKVVIEIRDGALVVDVQSSHESVHVSVPVTLVQSVARRLSRIEVHAKERFTHL